MIQLVQTCTTNINLYTRRYSLITFLWCALSNYSATPSHSGNQSRPPLHTYQWPPNTYRCSPLQYNGIQLFAYGPPMSSTSHNINKPKFGFLVRITWWQQFQKCRHTWSPTGRYRVLVFLLVSQNLWCNSEQTHIAKQDCLLLNNPPFLCGPACAYLRKQRSGGEIFSWQCSSNHPSRKSHHIWKHTNLI